jgi:hypothetical protein
MLSAQEPSMCTSATFGAPTIRSNIESVARALRRPLGEADDAGLAFRINGCVSVAVAPGRDNRLVVTLRLVEAAQVAPTVWINALSDSAAWGMSGERQRFVVVDGMFALLWTTPPLAERELLDQLYELFATAVALVSMGKQACA